MIRRSPILFKMEQHILELVNNKDLDTVKHLIVQFQQECPVSKEYPASWQKILYRIGKLRGIGELIVKNSKKRMHHTLSNHFLSQESYWFWTTISFSIITTFLVFSVPENAYPWIYARNILGSIYVLFLPGYCIIRVLFPEKISISSRTESRDNIVRIALSLGLNLSLIPLIGLFLNYTPWSIRFVPISISLLVITVTFAIVAVVREYQGKPLGSNVSELAR